jgi:hypothetical protein
MQEQGPVAGMTREDAQWQQAMLQAQVELAEAQRGLIIALQRWNDASFEVRLLGAGPSSQRRDTPT